MLPYKAVATTACAGDVPTIPMPREGRVDYSPDCFDDLDDEDPDDDLDI